MDGQNDGEKYLTLILFKTRLLGQNNLAYLEIPHFFFLTLQVLQQDALELKDRWQ